MGPRDSPCSNSEIFPSLRAFFRACPFFASFSTMGEQPLQADWSCLRPAAGTRISFGGKKPACLGFFPFKRFWPRQVLLIFPPFSSIRFLPHLTRTKGLGGRLLVHEEFPLLVVGVQLVPPHLTFLLSLPPFFFFSQSCPRGGMDDLRQS